MFQVFRDMHFCYGHRLQRYSGKCRHPHGHNGLARVTLSAARLNRLGMVLDFDDIRRTLQVWIDQNLDHRMILQRGDPLTAVLQKMGEPVYVLKDNPTAENIAREIYRVAKRLKLPVKTVTVWETDKSAATYGSD